MINWRRYATVGAALTAGLQGVVILIVSKQSLTTDQFAPVAQLWAIWAVSAAALNYGFQQWSAVHEAGFGLLCSRHGRPLLAGLAAVGAAVFIGTTAMRDELFSSGSMWWPLLAALLPLGTAAVGINRGELARTHRHLYLAVVIAAENTLRLAATIMLALLGAPAELYGFALLLGFSVALIPLPAARSWTLPPVRPLATASTAGLASHALLFGAPLILAVGGGDAEQVVLMFLVLSAVRAPFVLLQGLIPQLAVRFAARRDQANSTVRALALVGIVLATLAFAVATIAGDTIVGFVFSIRGEVDMVVYGLVAATAMISISLSLITVQLVASDKIIPLLLAWSLPTIATVASVATQALDEITTVAIWILICHVMVLAIVTTMSARQPAPFAFTRRPPDILQPGFDAPPKKSP